MANHTTRAVPTPTESPRRPWTDPKEDPERALQEHNALVNHAFRRSTPRKRAAPYADPEPERGELFMVFADPGSGDEVAVPIDTPGAGQEELAAVLGLLTFYLSAG